VWVKFTGCFHAQVLLMNPILLRFVSSGRPLRNEIMRACMDGVTGLQQACMEDDIHGFLRAPRPFLLAIVSATIDADDTIIHRILAGRSRGASGRYNKHSTRTPQLLWHMDTHYSTTCPLMICLVYDVLDTTRYEKQDIHVTSRHRLDAGLN
jgi:hypothetical protein